MKIGQIQVAGIKRYTKNDRVFSIIYYMNPFSDYDMEHSNDALGFQTGQEFTSIDTTGLKVGDIIEPLYSKGFGGKAVFSGYDLVKGKE